MLMKKEVIEDNENIKKEIKDLKKQLEEEKNAYNRMYNMYDEEKKKNERAIEYGKECINKDLDLDTLDEPYKSVFKACYEIHERYEKILKGEDKE